MGLIAARNARRVLTNNDQILAVELLAAAQAVDLADRSAGLSRAARAVYDTVRRVVPVLDQDRYMADDIELVADMLTHGELVDAVEAVNVTLH